MVTLDALRAQTKIAETIVRRGGDCLRALKESRPVLCADVETFFADPAAEDCETDANHGRIERPSP